MKKYIDLHIHLDGAITVDIAKKLAKLQNIVLPPTDEELEKLLVAPYDCSSLMEFLKCFDYTDSLLMTKEGISEAVYLVAEDMRRQGVIYAEIRFAPQLHQEKGMTQEEVVLAALEGLNKTKLKSNLILCCMRANGNDDENMETVRLAKKYLVEDGGVVGVDIAGDEVAFPLSNYKDLFDKIRRLRIPFTIHAGEAAGVDNIKCAIEYGATRIGHGVRIREDENVVQLAKEKGIFLEMCPTSNKVTHAVKDMKEYPFVKYLQKGLKVTLNTDDPAIENTTIEKEFDYIKNNFGLTSKQEQLILDNAIDAAFTSNKVKNMLRKTIKDIPNDNSSKWKVGMVVAIEMEAFFERFPDNIEIDIRGDYKLFFVEQEKFDLYVLQCGIGEIAAAAGVEYLICQCGVSTIVNFGVAGGLTQEMKKLKVCLVDRVVHYKYDCSECFDLKVGQVFEHDSIYIKTDENFVKKASEVMDNVVVATCCSGDKFVSTEEEKIYLHETFNGDVCDMESAAIVLICETNQVPCLIIKAVSDGLADGAEGFFAELKNASVLCLDVMLQVMEEL